MGLWCYSAACNAASSRKAGSEASPAGHREARACAGIQAASRYRRGAVRPRVAISFFFRSASSSAMLSPFASSHGSDDLRLGDAVEIILRARNPAGLRHVETKRGCELIAVTHAMRDAGMRLMNGVDRQPGAMGKERLAVVAYRARQENPTDPLHARAAPVARLWCRASTALSRREVLQTRERRR